LNINLLCFLAFVVVLCFGIDFEEQFGNQNPLTKGLASLAIPMLLFPVGILCSGMVAKEREGRTLDMLVTTALTSKEILLGKWNASILRIRWTFIFFAGMAGLAVLTGAIHPASFLLLIGAALVYIAFFANLGLFISTCCRTRFKAMLIFTAVFIAFGLGITVNLRPMYLSPGLLPWMNRVLFYLVSPLSTVQELTLDPRRAQNYSSDIMAALAAVGLVALAAWGLWRLTVYSFERSTGGRPRRRMPANHS
jgi:ABC-type Na+ efflux pump permease subunit